MVGFVSKRPLLLPGLKELYLEARDGMESVREEKEKFLREVADARKTINDISATLDAVNLRMALPRHHKQITMAKSIRSVWRSYQRLDENITDEMLLDDVTSYGVSVCTYSDDITRTSDSMYPASSEFTRCSESMSISTESSGSEDGYRICSSDTSASQSSSHLGDSVNSCMTADARTETKVNFRPISQCVSCVSQDLSSEVSSMDHLPGCVIPQTAMMMTCETTCVKRCIASVAEQLLTGCSSEESESDKSTEDERGFFGETSAITKYKEDSLRRCTNSSLFHHNGSSLHPSRPTYKHRQITQPSSNEGTSVASHYSSQSDCTQSMNLVRTDCEESSEDFTDQLNVCKIQTPSPVRKRSSVDSRCRAGRHESLAHPRSHQLKPQELFYTPTDSPHTVRYETAHQTQTVAISHRLSPTENSSLSRSSLHLSDLASNTSPASDTSMYLMSLTRSVADLRDFDDSICKTLHDRETGVRSAGDGMRVTLPPRPRCVGKDSSLSNIHKRTPAKEQSHSVPMSAQDRYEVKVMPATKERSQSRSWQRSLSKKLKTVGRQIHCEGANLPNLNTLALL